MSYNPFSLEGKTILVTGASSGIGRSTAIECSKMGAKVIITGRNEERLQETLQQMEGEGHKHIIAELTDQSDVENLVLAVDKLDGLVLCAGIPNTSPFVFSTREKYDRIFEVNYFAPVELLRLLVKKKRMNSQSSVVIVSSIGGTISFVPGNTIYGATKAAISSTMKYCAKELAPKKIRMNAVCPGIVNTKLINEGTISEEQYKARMELYPLKRFGEPEDIAWSIIYLLSDAASWITGHSIVIDGGISLVKI